MPMTIAHDDDRLAWHGAVSVERTADWSMPWRIPHEDRGLYWPPELLAKLMEPAGVRLAFRSDTALVAGTVVPLEADSAFRLDCCCDGEVVGSVPVTGRDAFRFEDLPAGEKRIALWLPQRGPFKLRSLTLSDGATLAPAPDDRPTWITYGSSISQCAAAASPTETWPAIVARGRGLNLTCLGLGGQCHLDSLIARQIRDLPADFISMCLGINIWGGASLGPRTFRGAIIGFARIIRERHPDAPLVLMSPIFGCDRETTPNAVGFTLPMMRDEVAAAAEALRAHGDGNVHYVNGLDILGPDHAHLLPDNLHPDAEGYRLMGRTFLEKVVPTVFP